MSLNLGTLEASIAVDTTKAERSLKTLEGKLAQTEVQLGKLEKGKTTVDVQSGKGLDEAKRKAADLGRALDEVSGKRTTVGVDAGGVKRGLSEAESAVRGFKQRADQEATITPDVDPGEFNNKLDGLVGKVTKAAAAMGVAFSAFDFAKNVTVAGREFQAEMNTLNAVTGASAQQLAAVQAKARELGSATDLTATSASDAAAAMTELAKGGFTVEQAMDAAKGTLQLAAAAQVEAAQAATIQSQALQSFGLNASEAARVSDILAGAANASSAEMTGIAQGMQQAGTVSKQFGLTIDDTATALAMFANAGIQGSDAGTLLKTALLSLTDQGKPAQNAIKELGLTVYDSQGKFVGLSSLMGQLQTAAANMTEEQYQAATATLFGSDAMRLAGIAAQQGADGFDTLKEAVTRQGQAAEVAAAQTAGLPGALERWQNTVEDLQLGVFDAIQDEAVGSLNMMVNVVDAAQPTIESLARTAAAAAGDVLKLADAAAHAPQGFKDAALGVGEFALVLAALKSGPAVTAFDKIKKGALATRTAFTDAGKAARDSATHYGAQAMVMRQVAAEQRALARTADTARARANAFWAAHDAQWSAATNTVRAQTAAMGGLVTHMGAGMKRGLGSVVDFLGGPWAVAFAGGAAAFTAFHNAGKAVEQANEAVAVSAKAAAEAQTQLKLAANGTEGIISGEALKAAETMVAGSLAEITEKGAAANKMFGSIRTAMDEVGVGTALLNGVTADATAQYQTALETARERGAQERALSKALRETGMSQEELNAVVAQGGPEFDKMIASLRGMGPEGEAVAQVLLKVRNEVEQAAQAGRDLPEAYVQAARAVETLADSASTAEQKLAAMNTVMQVMGLLPKDAERAMMEFRETIDQTAHDIEMLGRSSDFMGQAMFDASGKLQLKDANLATQELQKRIDDMAAALNQAAQKGVDVDEAFNNLEPTLKAIQDAWDLDTTQMDALRTQMEGIRDAAKFSVELEGADQVTQDLATILLTLKGAGEDTHFIAVDMPSEEVLEALDQIGVKVTDLGNGKVQIPVTADTRDAIDQLQEVSSFLDEAASKGISITALMDTTPMKLSAEEAQRILDSFEGQVVAPEANLILTKLREGVEVSKGELAALSAVTATPTADLDPARFNQGRDAVHKDLDKIKNRKTVAPIEADDKPARRTVSGFVNWLGTQLSRPFTARINATRNGASASFAADGGVIGRLAGGGVPYGRPGGGYVLPTAGPGTDRTDGILGVDQRGEPTAWVDRGEFVVNRGSTRDFEPTLWAINRGDAVGAMRTLAHKIDGMDVGALPRYADGGLVSASDLLAFASGRNVGGQKAPRSLEGAPYVWGGGLLGNWGDCSGAVSGLAAFATGAPLAGRKFATMNEGQVLAKMGARTGLGTGPRLAIGWFNGGPAGGHTSATIHSADGSAVNVEMGGGRGNGQIGGRAAGAGHPQYTNHAYIPLAGNDVGLGASFESTSVDGVNVSKGTQKFTVDWGEAGQLAAAFQENAHRAEALSRYRTGRFADGGVVEALVYDRGGILPPGGIAVNMGKRPEAVLDPNETTDYKRGRVNPQVDAAIIKLGEYVPAIAQEYPKVREAYPRLVESANNLSGWAARVVDTAARGDKAGLVDLGWEQTQAANTGLRALAPDASQFERWALHTNRAAGEALMGAASMTSMQWAQAGEKLGLSFVGEYVTPMLTANEQLEDTYVAQVDAADALKEAQENVTKAQQQLNEALGETPELSTQKQRQLEDAERKLAEAKAAPRAKGDKDGTAQAKKIADAERNLARVREDAAKDLEKAGAKSGEEVLAAREALKSAEADLTTAQGVIKSAAAATGQAQIAMALEAFAVIRKAAKAMFDFVSRINDHVLRSRAGFAEAVATATDSMRELVAATEQQREAVQQIRFQAAEMAMEVGRKTFNLRQAQVGVMRAQLEGVRDVRRAEANLRNERLRGVEDQGRIYHFDDLSIEYDKYINSTRMTLEDDFTWRVSSEIAAHKATTEAIGVELEERLAQMQHLTDEEKQLIRDVFALKFKGMDLEKATLEDQLRYTVAYNTAAKMGMNDLLNQQAAITPEILAMADMVNEAEWRRQERVYAATLQALDAAYEQQQAVVGLHRLTEDLATAIRRANAEAGALGMATDRAIAMNALAKLEASDAQADAELGNFKNRMGHFFDANKDGKFGLVANEGSLKYQAALATKENNKLLREQYTALLAQTKGGANFTMTEEDKRLYRLAGEAQAKGNTAAAQAFINSTSTGRSALTLEAKRVSDEFYAAQDRARDNTRRLDDMERKWAYESARLPREFQRADAGLMADSYAFMADAKRSSTMGEAKANMDLAIMSQAMAEAMRREAQTLPAEIGAKIAEVMQGTGYNPQRVQRIQLDLTQNALYHADDLENALNSVLSRVDGVELEVRKVQQGLTAGQTSNAVYSRAGLVRV